MGAQIDIRHLVTGTPGQNTVVGSAWWNVVEQFSALLMALGALPLLAAVAGVVALVSGQSPFVVHWRTGQHGKTFGMWKLRTMWAREREPRRARWVEYLRNSRVMFVKGAHDPRVTSRLAAILRRYSIDELPQLWHVVGGTMALAGPRPLTRQELDEHYDLDRVEVLRVKPGLTGLWQVLGRNRLTYAQRKRLDLFLVRHYTPGLYLWILGRTLKSVSSGSDAW